MARHFLIVFVDPAKRGPQTAAVVATTKQWAVEKFLRANSDLMVLRVGGVGRA